MSGTEIGQDLTCLLIGVMASVFSGVGMFTLNYILNRKESSSKKKENEGKKKLQSEPSNSKQDEMLENRQKMQATASPFSVVQLHPTSSGTSSTSKAMTSDSWKLQRDRAKEVEVSLDVRKSDDNSQNLDVNMGIVVDPDSKDPLIIKVDGIVDKDMNRANVSGKVTSKSRGSAQVEGQLKNNNKQMNLDTKKTATDKMVLRSKRT